MHEKRSHDRRPIALVQVHVQWQQQLSMTVKKDIMLILFVLNVLLLSSSGFLVRYCNVLRYLRLAYSKLREWPNGNTPMTTHVQTRAHTRASTHPWFVVVVFFMCVCFAYGKPSQHAEHDTPVAEPNKTKQCVHFVSLDTEMQKTLT